MARKGEGRNGDKKDRRRLKGKENKEKERESVRYVRKEEGGRER